uniref:Immunoglobulin domain-containing protein n=1 Tax=Amphilophus citrinellus TaxID=61819 RepID=A0A3Q0RB55_AMPCI
LGKPLTRVFLYLLADVDAVIVLTQTPAVHTVSPGQEAVLNCNIERYDGYYVSCHKQVPGGAPHFRAGFSSVKFNSKSSSNIDYQFIIKRADTGDSAVYYCQIWFGSARGAHVPQCRANRLSSKLPHLSFHHFLNVLFIFEILKVLKKILSNTEPFIKKKILSVAYLLLSYENYTVVCDSFCMLSTSFGNSESFYHRHLVISCWFAAWK